MRYKEFTLDKFQEEAIHAIEANNSVVVSAPTGSGKTLIADYIIDKYLKKKKRVIYTAPIKALSNQKYRDFCIEYGPENIGLMTGDVVKNADAPIIIMTTEIYRNMALSKDILEHISYVIFDEIHYINDIERGYVWEESIIFSKSDVRFLCLSATIPNADEFAAWIQAIKEHTVEVVHQTKRHVPLSQYWYDVELGITTLEKVADVAHIPTYDAIMGKNRRRQRGRRQSKFKSPSHIDLIREIKDKVPCLFFAFSRSKCEINARELMKANVFKENADISAFVRKKLKEGPEEIRSLQSTQILLATLPYGIGFHHAGLIPLIKEMVEELFAKGLIKVLYTTETFAVGINMPAKTVCFDSLRKYDGINFRFLNSKEFFQIAGRAGRRGIDKEGFVYVMIDRRDVDAKLLKKITDADVDPIKSQFRLSVNAVLNMLRNHKQEEIDTILKNNFFTYQKFGDDFASIKRNVFFNRFENIKKELEHLDYVRGSTLTKKGEFAAGIYADEIITGEIFATEFKDKLSEYKILLLLACIAYEGREKTEFYKEFQSKELSSLKQMIKKHPFLRREDRFKAMKELTAMIDPCYNRKDIFDIIEFTNLTEGDIIRFFRQILDRINQIKKATDDEQLRDKLHNCQTLIFDCLSDIDTI